MPDRFIAGEIRSFDALVVIYDLADFTNFLNQPDVQLHAPLYINKVIEAIDLAIFGGPAYWDSKLKFVPINPAERMPVHRKFMGDGELLIWNLENVKTTSREDFAGDLLNDLWNLHVSFERFVRKNQREVPIVGLPPEIRFGLTRGLVWPLKGTAGSRTEFIGAPVNLAARLQSYCPGLGVIASARTRLDPKKVKYFEYETVIAKKIKGFQREIVIIDRPSFTKLQKTTQIDLFQRLPQDKRPAAKAASGSPA